MTAIQQNDPFKGTLQNNTYYFGVGGDASIVQHIQLQWDAAISAVFTIWTTDFDEIRPAASARPGDWVQENPSTANIQFSPVGSCAVANATVTANLSTAGSASIHVGNFGARKMMVQVVVTNPGFARIGAAGKA